MDLKSYKLEELEPYLYSLYSDPRSLIPIPPTRLRSYMNNPRAELSDPVMYEMRKDGEVLGYRTLLPDCFYDREGNPQRFAWLSGNWVRPDMRRRGVSTKLLEEAEKHWDGRLMYTNYAPDSKALYDRTGRFKRFANRKGKRFYLRSASAELLAERVGTRGIFQSTDRLINNFRERRLEKFRARQKIRCSVEQVDGFIAQLSGLANKLQQDTLFRRDREIFEWALEYPWVTEQACDPINYHFSYKASRFENIIYHVINPDGTDQGILWLIIHNNVLSAPYLFAGNKELYPCMAETIIRLMIEEGCTHTTIRNPELMEAMMASKKVFLSTRNLPQQLFAHEKLISLLPEQAVIHDGDGDVMFTG